MLLEPRHATTLVPIRLVTRSALVKWTVLSLLRYPTGTRTRDLRRDSWLPLPSTTVSRVANLRKYSGHVGPNERQRTRWTLRDGSACPPPVYPSKWGVLPLHTVQLPAVLLVGEVAREHRPSTGCAKPASFDASAWRTPSGSPGTRLRPTKFRGASTDTETASTR